MPRTSSADIARRNQELLDDYASNPFQTHKDLGLRHGVTVQTVSLLLTKSGLTSRIDRKPRVKLQDRKAISNFHAILGEHIRQGLVALSLDNEAEVDFQLSKHALALGMSGMRLSTILLGVEDPTLSELLAICDRIKKPLKDVLLRAQQQEASACLKKLEISGSSPL